MVSKYAIKWTPSEVEVLKSQYGKILSKDLGVQLGKTTNAIMRKARLLGLKSRYKGSPAYAITKIPYHQRKKITEHPIWRKEGEIYDCRKTKYIKIDGKRMVYARYLMKQAGHDITGKVVVHLDGDTSNNDIDNLELLTRKENQQRNRNRFKDPEMHGYRVRMSLTGESWVDLVLKGIVT